MKHGLRKFGFLIILCAGAVSCATLGSSLSGLGEEFGNLFTSEGALASEGTDSEVDVGDSGASQNPEASAAQDQEEQIPLKSEESRSDGDADTDFVWDLQKLDTAREVTYLSEIEKDVVLELNKVRSNPSAYAEAHIEPRRRYFRGSLFEQPGKIPLQTREGARALDECVGALEGAQPVGLLFPSSGLTSAARDHAEDQEKTGRTGHAGSDGSNMEQRISRHGEWDKLIGENISYGSGNARDIVIQLLIDDGVPSRGHRQNIMNGGFARIGTAIAGHPDYGFVCVMDFAGEYSDRE